VASSEAHFKMMRVVDELLHGRALCPECLEDSGNEVRYHADEMRWHCRDCGHDCTGIKMRVPLWVFDSGLLIVNDGELLSRA